MPFRHVAPLAAALALLACLSAPLTASAKVRTGPAGEAFYEPPSKLPGKTHGDLIWARNIQSGARLDNSSANKLVLYRSTGVNGRKVAVSGVVSLPKGRAPKGGWPVVAWSHGTTGTADICAPSKDKTTAGNDSYKLMATWLRRGYAVVRTDYEGLGTPGPHPYLAGDSAGHSSLDIIRAARQLDPRVGTTFVTSGHSQGGHATIWAAFVARNYVPELKLRGTVAFAPASHIGEQGSAIPALTTPAGPLGGLVAMILAGVNVQHPELDGIFSDKFKALYPQIEERCLGDLGKNDSFGGLAPAEFFAPGADLSRAFTAIDNNDPETLRLSSAPLLIEQGGADTTVVPTYSQQLTDELKSNGAKVTYETYAGDNHGTIVTGAAAKHATAFIAKRLK